MIVLGLTGSIGMGKSTVAAMFRRLGVPVFDADAEVHRLYGPGGRLVAAIEALHPGTTHAGGVDRRRLGEIVLGDPQALGRIERLLHPAVAAARLRFLQHNRARRLIVLDIPLLFEKAPRGARIPGINLVAVVSAPAWMQRRRVLARAGMSAARLARIRALQVPDRIKRRRADIVIETGAGLAETRLAIARIVACLHRQGRRYSRSCARSSSIPRPRG